MLIFQIEVYANYILTFILLLLNNALWEYWFLGFLLKIADVTHVDCIQAFLYEYCCFGV